jgi:hypothetical protein
MQILDKKSKKMEEIAGSEGQVCSQCSERPAEIFQVTGEYCLECWQVITHTNTN